MISYVSHHLAECRDLHLLLALQFLGSWKTYFGAKDLRASAWNLLHPWGKFERKQECWEAFSRSKILLNTGREHRKIYMFRSRGLENF